jgi:hypothetical protein
MATRQWQDSFSLGCEASGTQGVLDLPSSWMVNKTGIELKRGALDKVERQFSLWNARTVRICNTLKAPPAPL